MSVPIEIEVPEFDAAAPVFRAWAGPHGAVRFLFTHDPILAVDLPGRRGYLIDEIYLAVAWVAEGAEDLVQGLRAQGIDVVERPARGANKVHEDMLDTVMRRGKVPRAAS